MFCNKLKQINGSSIDRKFLLRQKSAAAKGGCVGGEESVACTSQHTNSWENLAGWVAAAGDKKLVSR